MVYFTDITAKISDFSYKDIVQHSQDMILVTEAQNIDAPLSPKIIYANEALCKHTEYSLEELLGETPAFFKVPQLTKPLRCVFGRHLLINAHVPKHF